MKFTKEEVVAKAKELGLTLTDAEIEQLMNDGKLPEKQEHRTGTTVEDLITKYSARQLAEMLMETRGEAADRRREARSLKEQAEQLTKEINGLKDMVGKYPDLEMKMKSMETQLQSVRDSEKKRREAVLLKLDEKKRGTVSYLLDAEKIGAEQFDATVDLLMTSKTNGVDSPTPGGAPLPIQLSTAEKQEADRMGLNATDYRAIMERRKGRTPATITPQRPALPVT